MKNITTLLASLLLSINLFSQDLTPLQTGNKMPEVTPLEIYGSTNTFDFQEKKNKFIIIDFFTTGCVPCIAAIPKMQALQNEFKDQLEVIMVTSDGAEKVEALKKTSDIFKKNTLPMVVADKQLKKLFPFQVVPTHIWIDENGTYLYATDGESSNRENIKQYFQKRPVTMGKGITDFSRNQSIWKQLNKTSVQPLYTSIVTRRIEAIGSSSGYTRDSINLKLIGYEARNCNPLTILIAAMQDKKNTFSDWRRVVLEGKAKEYKFPDKMSKEWSMEHSYCYALYHQNASEQEIKESMLMDMKRFFSLSAKIEERTSPVLVLKLVDRSKLKSEKTKRIIHFKVDDDTDYQLEHVSMREFFNSTVGYPGRKYGLPVLNEADYDGTFDISLKGKINDLDNVRKQLKKYGIEFVEEQRTLSYLVLYGE